MDYSLAPAWKWIADKEAALLLTKLNMPPHHRLLLLSDGSLTNFLETLNQSPLDVEIKNHESRKIQKEEAAYLEVDASEEAIIRDVWLTQGKKKLVYAHSVFPFAGLDKKFMDTISTSIEPLGKSLTNRGLLTFKDKLEICAVRCNHVNNALNLAPETNLWAKHYRLLAQTPSGGKGITASITEIFSPELTGMPPLK